MVIFNYILKDEDQQIVALLQEADKVKGILQSKDHLGHSPLFVAKLYNKQNIERLLLEKNATLNELDQKNMTLFKAIKANDIETFEILLQSINLDDLYQIKEVVNIKNPASSDRPQKDPLPG